MQLFIFSLLLLGVSLGLASPSGLRQVKLQRGSCPPFWYTFNGRCYKYVSSRLTWADAELYCVSERANLVSIHSLEEHIFVRSLIQNFDHLQGVTWIGFSDKHKPSGWMWSDGCPANFLYWANGQPNNGGGSCVEINFGSDGRWNDRSPCSTTYPSVCASRIPVCPS